MSDTKDAKFWELIMNVKSFKRSAASITDASTNSIIVAASDQDIDLVSEPRLEVVELAKFIANIEPSYINSEGKYITLSMIRSLAAYSKDDLAFIQDKFAEAVKPYISVGPVTEVVGSKIRVNTSLTKPKLIKAALSHLFTGSEIFKDTKDFKNLLSHSCLVSNQKVSYAYMIGTALNLKYNSVPEMLNDLAITFVDQGDNIRQIGRLVFYDGSVRTEAL